MKENGHNDVEKTALLLNNPWAQTGALSIEITNYKKVRLQLNPSKIESFIYGFIYLK